MQKPVSLYQAIWVRSPGSGICRFFKKVGASVQKEDELATIFDPFGTAQQFLVRAPCEGIVIEQNILPLTNEGEPLMRIAQTVKTGG